MDSRLTYWSKKNKRFEIYTDGIVHYGSITDRLAEYEDTGLTPEEIRQLIKQKENLLEDMATMATALNKYVEAEKELNQLHYINKEIEVLKNQLDELNSAY